MKSELAEKVASKKIKDYSYAVAFFIIFAFFVFFAIRPNIETAFTLQKELGTLKDLDKNYEAAIVHIINVQTILEKYRDQVPMLSDALPLNPQVNKVVDDLHIAASSSGLLMKELDINEVNLKEVEQKTLRSFQINLSTDADFSTVKNFFLTLNNQRRLKTIDNLIIKQDKISSGSGQLRIQMNITGYYL